jgi:hypothetical protein
MSDNTVLQTKYATEFVAAYEQKQSLLRGTVTTEGEVKGNQFIFIIEGTADTAVSRGANGLIPVADDTQSSTTLTLAEYHHLARKTNFNIHSSSVPQRLSMQRRGIISINNKTDQLIIDQLETTSYNTGGAAAASLALMLEGCSLLDAANVPDDGERYGLLTPVAWAHMMKVTQFTSSDYVPDKPFMRAGFSQWRNWNGVKWCRHPNLPGKGTNAAKCFIYHKSSLGHGLNQGEMQTKVGQNEEHDYSWARTSAYQGSKALQDEGIIQVNHDDTASL